MRMDKLTSRFQQALADAQSLAVGRDNNLVEPAHVMAALLSQQGGSTVPLLTQAGVNVQALRARVDQYLDKLPRVSGQEGNVSISNDLNRLLNLTFDGFEREHVSHFVSKPAPSTPPDYWAVANRARQIQEPEIRWVYRRSNAARDPRR